MIQGLADLWSYLAPAHAFITSIALSLVTALALRFFAAKVVVVWGSASSSYHVFELPEKRGGGQASIWTEKFYVQNTGHKPAYEIELVFSDVPTSYSLWAPREHKSGPLAGGGFSIRVPSLAPHELLIVDMIDIDTKNVRLLSVNCPEVISRRVPFLPARQFGRLFNAAVALLMFLGLITAFYVIIQLVLGALK